LIFKLIFSFFIASKFTILRLSMIIDFVANVWQKIIRNNIVYLLHIEIQFDCLYLVLWNCRLARVWPINHGHTFEYNTNIYTSTPIIIFKNNIIQCNYKCWYRVYVSDTETRLIHRVYVLHSVLLWITAMQCWWGRGIIGMIKFRCPYLC
jgi:hypothetical protein